LVKGSDCFVGVNLIWKEICCPGLVKCPVVTAVVRSGEVGIFLIEGILISVNRNHVSRKTVVCVNLKIQDVLDNGPVFVKVAVMQDVLAGSYHRHVLVHLTFRQEQAVLKGNTRQVIAVVKPENVISHGLEGAIPGIVNKCKGVGGTSI
jgi:hypothetical protein